MNPLSCGAIPHRTNGSGNVQVVDDDGDPQSDSDSSSSENDNSMSSQYNNDSSSGSGSGNYDEVGDGSVWDDDSHYSDSESSNDSLHLGVNQNNCDHSKSTLIHRRGKYYCADDDRFDNMNAGENEANPRRQMDPRNGDYNNDHCRTRRRRQSERLRREEYEGKYKTYAMKCCIKYLCCQTRKRSTKVLIVAFVSWTIAQIFYFSWKIEIFNLLFSDRNPRVQWKRGMSGRERKALLYKSDPFNHRDLYQTHSQEDMAILREKLRKEAREVLGTAAGDDDFDPNYYLRDNGGKPNKVNKRKHRDKNSRDSSGSTWKERIREGCAALEWHSFHFPNCNEIHEINLRNVVRRRRSVTSRDVNSTTAEPSLPWGFVGNGFWRDVFMCDPREEAISRSTSLSSGAAASILPQAPAVLKVMKSEHSYDLRNFQRHRRDALVMERLTFSNHVVPIYGYCANSVLTQAISHTLDDVIFARENEVVKAWSPRGGFVTKPPLESWMGRDEDGHLLATRETEIGRIRLALGVFRGLRDLHEGDKLSKGSMEWLPIIHADLQAKQYLIDSTTGHIYLNDFNRCRFITKVDQSKNSNTSSTNTDASGGERLESCPVYIPSAPGIARAPEEYDMAVLSEKLDIYSAGNILYEIITGSHIWDNERHKNTRAAIQRGERPQVNTTIRNAVGTVDAELTGLLDRLYAHDPKMRMSANEVVIQLESLLEREAITKRARSVRSDRTRLDLDDQVEGTHRRELKVRRKV